MSEKLPDLVSATLQDIVKNGWTVAALVLVDDENPRYYVSARFLLWWLNLWVDSDGMDEWKARSASLHWRTLEQGRGGLIYISAADVHTVVRLRRDELVSWFEAGMILGKLSV